MVALLVGGRFNGVVTKISQFDPLLVDPTSVLTAELEDTIQSNSSTILTDKYTLMYVSEDQQYAIYSCLSKEDTSETLVMIH